MLVACRPIQLWTTVFVQPVDLLVPVPRLQPCLRMLLRVEVLHQTFAKFGKVKKVLVTKASAGPHQHTPTPSLCSTGRTMENRSFWFVLAPKTRETGLAF